MKSSARQKNLNKADFMLIFAFFLFILAIIFKLYYSSYPLIASLFLLTAEASLVGGIADWFAVTALFRKPLGVSYHTALIPRNRDKLIFALSDAIENDFLSKEIILKKLKEVKLLDLMQNSFNDRKSSVFYRKSLKIISYNLISILEPDRISRHLEKLLKKHLKDQSLAPHIYKISNWIIKTGKISFIYNFILAELTNFVGKAETKNKIYNYLVKIQEEKVGDDAFANLTTLFMEQIGAIKLDEAAAIIQDEVLKFLQQSTSKDNQIRTWFEQKMSETVTELANNEVWINAIETWKNGFLERFNLLPFLNSIIVSLQQEAENPKQQEQKDLFLIVLKEFEFYLNNFNQDIETKEKTEEYLQSLFKMLIENNHYLLGKIVKESLIKMSDEDLSDFVETKTKDDLEWIRINGVIIGGIIGFGLGLFMHFVYEPYILTFVQLNLF